jgi:hypothetical protein
MTAPLLPTRFLFRFSAACKHHDPLWTAKGASLVPANLDETCRLVSLAELEGRTAWADVRAAWSEAGLAFTVRVEGKRRPPWCDPSQPEASDGLHLWIDTRDVHNVHRAGRFCHRFVFLPEKVPEKGSELFSGGKTARTKTAVSRKTVLTPFFLPINRAREQPRPVPEGSLQARCQALKDGYLLEALIPADSLTGFDPAEHPRLGFTYAVLDRELGEQTFGVGSPMPYQEDPSLWATLELTK